MIRVLTEDIQSLLKSDSISDTDKSLLDKYLDILDRFEFAGKTNYDTKIIEWARKLETLNLSKDILKRLAGKNRFFEWAIQTHDYKKEDIEALYQILTDDTFEITDADNSKFNLDTYLNGNKLVDVIKAKEYYKDFAEKNNVSLQSILHKTNKAELKPNLLQELDEVGNTTDTNKEDESQDKNTNKNIVTYEELFKEYPNLKLQDGVRLNKSQLQTRNNYIRKIAQMALSGDNWGIGEFNKLFKGLNYNWKGNLPKSVPSQNVMEIIVDNIQDDNLSIEDSVFIQDQSFYNNVSEKDYNLYLKNYKKLRRSGLSSENAVKAMKDENNNLYAPERKLTTSKRSSNSDQITSREFKNALNKNNVQLDDTTRNAILKAVNDLLMS